LQISVTVAFHPSSRSDVRPGSFKQKANYQSERQLERRELAVLGATVEQDAIHNLAKIGTAFKP
jgi:hypothetical protein